MVKTVISIATIISLSLSVTGCLGGYQASWQQQGVSHHDTNSNISECKYQAALHGIPANQQQELITNCMQSKGFRYQ
ncbi:MAG: hypothetical protein Q8Q54_13755 [Methylococcales bacterium]|nr:hypothetical protein [Methylococcales bacterium]MDP3839977.1 hypothetical protein [Methylococcales bacterium]